MSVGCNAIIKTYLAHKNIFIAFRVNDAPIQTAHDSRNIFV